jgi:ATP-binding cassette subfamily C exporter for protease/lipase
MEKFQANAESNHQRHSELALSLIACKSAFFHVAAFSAFINLLWLTPSVYMMQVYDRVLVSRSEMTLFFLTTIAIGLFALMALLEWVRSQILVQVSNKLDASLSDQVFKSTFLMNLKGTGVSASQSLGDLATVRQFLTGAGLFAFFDIPWLPIYLLTIFMVNVWVGWFALGAIIILGALAWANEAVTRKPLTDAGKFATVSSEQATSQLRNAEAIQAMGMLPRLTSRWLSVHQNYLNLQSAASQKASVISALTKFFRILTQSLILGLGALLVLEDQMSAGMMIGGSILLGRALAPLEQFIAVSRQFSSARLAYSRLDQLLKQGKTRDHQIDLPAPSGAVQLQSATAIPPSSRTPVLGDVSFELNPGEVLVVVGPSGSGKSSLARLLVGVWPAVGGKVRLDGADITQWDTARLGPHLGYLPQDIEIFNGTVAENIGRFTELNSEKIIAAARAANVHELILQMPNGYETEIGGASGYRLSGGQQQRIALARALYGEPALIVLDEPNSNLDQAGEQALVESLISVRKRGGTVVVITHRTNILQVATKVLVLANGRVVAFGPPDQVLNSGGVRVVSGGR